MNSLQQRLGTSLARLTDLSDIKAAFNLWQKGNYQENTALQLSYSTISTKNTLLPVCGLVDFCNYISGLKFAPEDIYYLAALREGGSPVFNESFLNYLQRLDFSFELYAVPEGSLVFQHEPMLIISGQRIQLQLIEKALKEIYAFQSHAAAFAAGLLDDFSDKNIDAYPFADAFSYDRSIKIGTACKNNNDEGLKLLKLRFTINPADPDIRFRRYFDQKGLPFADCIDFPQKFTVDSEYNEMLKHIFSKGKLLYNFPADAEIIENCKAMALKFSKVELNSFEIIEPQSSN